MFTDSYKIIEEGHIFLSGKSVGVSGVAAETIASLTGGDVTVEFKPIDDVAKKLVAEKLGKEYVENAEGFIIEVGERLLYMQIPSLLNFLRRAQLKINTLMAKSTVVCGGVILLCRTVHFVCSFRLKKIWTIFINL